MERMIFRDGFYMGYLGLYDPNDIFAIVEALPDLFASFPYALITKNDGGGGTWLEANFMSFRDDEFPHLQPQVIEGIAILLGTADFLTTARSDSYFSGDFAEVWFFQARPEHAPSESVRLISECPIPDAPERQTPIIDWMVQSGCVLGLGDGAGINFVTPIEEYARRLLNTHDFDAESTGTRETARQKLPLTGPPGTWKETNSFPRTQ